MEQNTCVRTIKTSDWFEQSSHKCGRNAVIQDTNGRWLCQRCFNKWRRKTEKAKHNKV